MTEIDGFCREIPSAQTELDVFKGQWLYNLPVAGAVSGTAVGYVDLHPTVWMAEQAFGPLRGMSCLELGPFEGEISWSLHCAGADVVSVEARRRNFMKCLVAKNLLGMNQVRFMLGDFVRHLEEPGPEYDFCMATGVLYHMPEPLRLIELLATRCRRVLIGTAYVAPQIFNLDTIPDSSGLPKVAWTFPDKEGELFEYKGLTVRQYRQVYPFDAEVHWNQGAGGPALHANMLGAADILSAAEHFGLRIVGEVMDRPDGDRAPSIYFCAERNPTA
jgi:hypothetical protein